MESSLTVYLSHLLNSEKKSAIDLIGLIQPRFYPSMIGLKSRRSFRKTPNTGHAVDKVLCSAALCCCSAQEQRPKLSETPDLLTPPGPTRKLLLSSRGKYHRLHEERWSLRETAPHLPSTR